MPDEPSLILQAAYRHDWAEVERIRSSDGVRNLWEAAAAGDAAAGTGFLQQDSSAITSVTPDGFTPLHLAAYFGHPDVVDLLLRHGAEPNAVAENPTRVQPLHSAVAGRNVDCVRLLLNAGAEPDGQQAGGFTPLMAAAAHQDDDIIQLLLRAGANPEVASEDGRTASDFAGGKPVAPT